MKYLHFSVTTINFSVASLRTPIQFALAFLMTSAVRISLDCRNYCEVSLGLGINKAIIVINTTGGRGDRSPLPLCSGRCVLLCTLAADLTSPCDVITSSSTFDELLGVEVETYQFVTRV